MPSFRITLKSRNLTGLKLEEKKMKAGRPTWIEEKKTKTNTKKSMIDLSLLV